MGEQLIDYKPVRYSTAITIFAYISIVSFFVLPAFAFSSVSIKVQVVEMLLPLISVFVFTNYNASAFKRYKTMWWPWLAFAACILLSLICNYTINCGHDYFEVLKILKYVVYTLFFILALPKIQLDRLLKILVIFLTLFAVCNYFNIFDFNNKVLPYYGSEAQWKFFGLNSLGQPDTKRLIGTVGNPNYNAILFLFFLAYFISREQNIISAYTIVSIVMVIGTQSRTGLVAMLAIFIIASFYQKSFAKSLAIYVLVALLSVVLFYVLGNTYITAFDERAIHSKSVMGRIEMWQLLATMYVQHPIVGYGPYKTFFYSHDYYSESEYFLYLWRYGIVGFIVFMIAVLSQLLYSYRNIKIGYSGKMFFMFSLAMLICSLTNNPFSEQNIWMIHSLATAICYQSISIPPSA